MDRMRIAELIVLGCAFTLGVSTTMMVLLLMGNDLRYTPEVQLDDMNYGNENFSSVEVRPFTVNFMPLDQINELWRRKNITKYGNRTILAFNDMTNRIVYISLTKDKDINGRYMPDLCTLGHEVWHNEELGGVWHD